MTTDAVGGVWTYSLDLARGLAALGAETVLAVLGPAPAADQRAAAERVPGLSLRIRSGKLEWMPDPWSDVDEAGAWLLALAESEGADLVHLNGFALAALPWPVPVLIAAHSCVLSWWRACKGGTAPGAWSEYALRVGRGLASADCVAAPSRAMLAALREHYAFAAPARIIPNGRNGADFAPAAKRPFLLAAGRLWDEAKNLPALARAAEGLAWPLYLAGETVSPGSGRELFPGPHGLGRLSTGELAAWMGHAGIFVHPARYEPFGLAPLEAALSGCALVLGDIPSLREVWAESAAFAPPDDEAALRSVLERLIVDAGERQRLALAAGKRAQRYSVPAMAQAYYSAYADLIGSWAPVRRLSGAR